MSRYIQSCQQTFNILSILKIKILLRNQTRLIKFNPLRNGQQTKTQKNKSKIKLKTRARSLKFIISSYQVICVQERERERERERD